MTSNEVIVQVIEFTVLAFSQQILKLGLEIRGLENVITFNPRWLEGSVVVA